MGILDFLSGNGDQPASPYGALYQAPPDLGWFERLMGGQFGDPSKMSTVNPNAAPAPTGPPLPPFMAGLGATDRTPTGLPNPLPESAAPSFGAGATPFGFAGPGSNMVAPSQIAAPAAAPAPAPAPGPSPADTTAMFAGGGSDPVPFQGAGGLPAAGPGPNMVVGSLGSEIPVPTFGAPDPATLPAKSAPAQYSAPASPAPFSLSGAGDAIGDRLMKGLRGFAGNLQNGPIAALIGGGGSLISGRESDPTTIAQGKVNATGQALLQKGAPIEDVKAAIANPALMTSLLAQYYGKDKYSVVTTGKDGMGNETHKVFNSTDGTFKDIPGGAPGVAGSENGMGAGFGDMTKKGAEYLATVPPQIRSTMSGLVDGTVQPPTSFAMAKPYWQNMIAGAKNLDPSFDENTWAARHKMSVDHASSGNSSMGGILSNGKSAFEHLKTYSNKLADVGNYNGPDIPGGAIVGELGNWVGNRVLPRAGTLDKIAGANTAGLKYGQESTKFYAGSGGGAEERMSALTNNDAKSTTAAQQAGFLQSEKELMLGRLREKENELRKTMGDGFLQKNPVFTPELAETIKIIDGNIAKLRGTAPADAAPAAAPGAAAPLPAGWSVTERH